MELVPAKAWNTNLRSMLSKDDWDTIRNICYRNANFRCEICGGSNDYPKVPWRVECHEVWRFDPDNLTQTLAGLASLCTACHRVKHAGLWATRGYAPQILAQLMRVNGMTKEDAKEYMLTEYKRYQDTLSHLTWNKPDLSFIEDYTAGVVRAPNP